MTGAPRVLVADDEREILVSCVKILERAGYEVTTAADGTEAIEHLKSARYDLFFVDLRMPGRSGLEILALARALDPRLVIVMFTAFATLETAVDAVKRGAFDYLAKPFTADRLVEVAGGALRHRRLDDVATPADETGAAPGFDRILGASEAMQTVFATIQKVARTDANILLQSETGTGKELLARTIHARSLRRDCPFVAIDCAALPDTLLESEL
ncbi:MAG: response regulator, partial [Gemmatimonadaceae bacterium]|nr:response regulator [Gemmatimonadaceae bacterium]